MIEDQKDVTRQVAFEHFVTKCDTLLILSDCSIDKLENEAPLFFRTPARL